MCPQAIPLHPEPDRLQVTTCSPVPVTCAENCCCAPGLMATEDGETVTTIVAEADGTSHSDAPRTLRMTNSFPLQLMALQSAATPSAQCFGSMAHISAGEV